MRLFSHFRTLKKRVQFFIHSLFWGGQNVSWSHKVSWWPDKHYDNKGLTVESAREREWHIIGQRVIHMQAQLPFTLLVHERGERCRNIMSENEQYTWVHRVQLPALQIMEFFISKCCLLWCTHWVSHGYCCVVPHLQVCANCACCLSLLHMCHLHTLDVLHCIVVSYCNEKGKSVLILLPC